MKVGGDFFVAQYDYTSPNESNSLLSFKVGDRFLLVKVPDEDTNWLWVCDQDASFGYVPARFVRQESVRF